MPTKRKTAEQAQGTAPETETTSVPQSERQPGDESPERTRTFAPDPFPIDIDTRAGARLLAGRRYYDKQSGSYAFRNLQIQFDEKPSQPIREKIRAAGFEWDADAESWIKVLPQDNSRDGRRAALALFEEVTGMLRAAKGLGPSPEKTPF
jgi:hypothetical protein